MRFPALHSEITEFLKKSIEHEYSKVVFEGLRVASAFLHALGKTGAGTIDAKY